MKQRITELKSRFEALSLRERALVVLSLLAASWMSWEFSLGAYQRGEIAQLERGVNLGQQKISQEVATQEALQRQKAGDPARGLKAERIQLNAELGAIQSQLKTAIGRFVDPGLMPSLLEDVLARHEGITLLQVSALPVKPMLLDANDKHSVVPGLYRHGMRLRLSGRYFDILDYLGELEGSHWQFIWQELDYEVVQYPLAQVWIELETLSQEKSWLGV